MELFVIGLVFGAATAQGKAVTKAVAKGYMAVSEKTREVVSTLREDMRGAIDEARVERDQDETDQEIAGHDAEALALREETTPIPVVASAASASAEASPAPAAKAKQTPTVMKSLAKRYMLMTEKTRDAVSGIRENVRDAIEEARYERELAAQRTAAQAESEGTEEPAHEVVAAPTPVKNKTAVAARSTRTKASAVKATSEPVKPARSTRTKTSVPKAASASATVPATNAAAPTKRGRPKKTEAAPKQSAKDALIEVAEIAADAR
jgi:hypothetical protein